MKRTHEPIIKNEIRSIAERIDFEMGKQINEKFNSAVDDIDVIPGLDRKKFWKFARLLKNRPKQIPHLNSNFNINGNFISGLKNGAMCVR